MTNSQTQPQTLARVPSGIPGLDEILKGGFLQAGIYIIMGTPGTGKTILANQICFNHVASGGKAVYVTLLTETHGRMLSHLKSLDFFDADPLADSLYYISGYQALEKEGLDGLLKLLRRVIRDHRASLLVIDGLVTAAAFAKSEVDFKRLIHELQVYLEATGCTTFLLTQPDTHHGLQAEHTMVDGVLALYDREVGQRATRSLEVRKFRGSRHLRGQHHFIISDAGITVHPRTEALLRPQHPPEDEVRTRVPFGVANLDKMMEGGLLSGSTTLVLGTPGSGKTLLGLHFLAAGAAAGEVGLHFGLYEMPPRLKLKGDQIGLDLSGHLRQGMIDIIWHSPTELHLDLLVQQLLDVIEKRQVRRLFLDGITAFYQAAAYPERLPRLFTALANELRARQVTTIFSCDTNLLFAPALEVPFEGVSAITDNIILLRTVELRSQLYRLISLIKMRESGHDTSLREFRISDHGIDVATTFESAEAILTGVAHNNSTLSHPSSFEQSSPNRGK